MKTRRTIGALIICVLICSSFLTAFAEETIVILLPDDQTINRELRTAAEAGDADAMFEIGHLYWYGDGVEENDEMALKWYKAAAASGNSIAMNEVGEFYYYGIGTVINFGEALAWYEKSAEAGNVFGMMNTAYMYYNGLGVIASANTAQQWTIKALENGYPPDAVRLQAKGMRYNDELWETPVYEPDEPLRNSREFRLYAYIGWADKVELGSHRIYVCIDKQNNTWLECGTINIPAFGEIYSTVVNMNGSWTVEGIALLPTNSNGGPENRTVWIEPVDIPVNSDPVDWSGLDTSSQLLETGEVLFSVQLSPEQVRDYEGASLLFVMPNFGMDSDTFYSFYKTDSVSLGQDGVLSAKCRPSAYYALDENNEILAGPIGCVFQPGGFATFLTLYLDNPSLLQSVEKLYMFYDYYISAGGHLVPHDIRVSGLEYDNESVASDSEVLEDYDFVKFVFWESGHKYNDQGSIPGFESWETNGVTAPSIDLPSTWHLDLAEYHDADDNVASATFQIVDKRGDVHSSKITRVFP